MRSFAEYQQIFGGLWQPSMLAYAVEQYFDSGGREAVVVRVINGGAPATITLPCGKESLQLEAVSPGSRETLRASVDYDNIGSNEDDRFNLVLQRVRTLGSEHIEDQEIFRRLSIEPGTTRFVVRALQESMLVRVRGVVPSVRPDRTFRAGARHPIGYVDSNPDGDDGVPLTDYDLIGSPDRGTGLFALRDAEDLHFLCIPPPARDRDVGPSLLLVAAQFCRERRALFIVDPPGNWETCDEALRGLRGLAFESENALMCFPRIQAFDKLRGRLETFANSAAVAGTFARMDAHHSPLDAAPDEPLLLRPGARPVRLLTEAEGLRLGAQGINPLQCVRPTTPGHSPLKTLARGSAVGPDSVLLMARRRQLLTINSLELGTRWARFEGRDRNSWPKLTRQVRAFLLSLAATGGLGKAAGTEFGEVVCDARLHNETDLLDGTVHVPGVAAHVARRRISRVHDHAWPGRQPDPVGRLAPPAGGDAADRAGSRSASCRAGPEFARRHGAAAHPCARALWFGARSARRHGIVNDARDRAVRSRHRPASRSEPGRPALRRVRPSRTALLASPTPA